MDDKSNSIAGNLIRSPLIAIMVVLLLVLMIGLVGNFFLAGQATQQQALVSGYANEVKVLSQEVAKHSVSASSGEINAFSLLGDSKNQLDNMIANLNGIDSSTSDELNQVGSLWNGMKTNVDIILDYQSGVLVLRDISSDLAITMSAIQTENNKVVASLLRSSGPSNEVALAQRQSMLIERMSRSVDKALVSGAKHLRCRLKSRQYPRTE